MQNLSCSAAVTIIEVCDQLDPCEGTVCPGTCINPNPNALHCTLLELTLQQLKEKGTCCILRLRPQSSRWQHKFKAHLSDTFLFSSVCRPRLARQLPAEVGVLVAFKFAVAKPNTICKCRKMNVASKQCLVGGFFNPNPKA